MRRRAGLLLAAPLLSGMLLLVLPACGTTLNAAGVYGYRNLEDPFAGVRSSWNETINGLHCMVLDLPFSFLVDLLLLPFTLLHASGEPPAKAQPPAGGS